MEQKVSFDQLEEFLDRVRSFVRNRNELIQPGTTKFSLWEKQRSAIKEDEYLNRTEIDQLFYYILEYDYLDGKNIVFRDILTEQMYREYLDYKEDRELKQRQLQNAQAYQQYLNELTNKYEYKVVKLSDKLLGGTNKEKLQRILSLHAKEGWKFIEMVSNEKYSLLTGMDAGKGELLLIFERPSFAAWLQKRM